MESWESWHGVVKALYQQPDKICFEKIWTDISISIYNGFFLGECLLYICLQVTLCLVMNDWMFLGLDG